MNSQKMKLTTEETQALSVAELEQATGGQGGLYAVLPSTNVRVRDYFPHGIIIDPHFLSDMSNVAQQVRGL